MWWAQLTHLLRVLQAQTNVQNNVMYKIRQLNVRAPARVSNVQLGAGDAYTIHELISCAPAPQSVYGGGVASSTMAMSVDS